MRRIISLMIVLVIIFGLTVATYATLFDMGDGTVYDNDTQLSWLMDAGMGGQQNWDDAMAWAGSLAYAGFDDWRLPTTPGGFGYTSVGEMGHLYYSEGISSVTPGFFTNLQSDYYWTGTEYAPDTNAAWYYLLSGGGPHTGGAQSASSKDHPRFAWAVHSGYRTVSIPETPSPVPEPSTMLLLGSGLIGLLGFRKNFKK